MLIDEILISALPGDRRAAARWQGSLVRLILDGDGDQLRCGDLRLGRVVAMAPAIGAVFVDIGAERPGLLMRADGPSGRPLGEGEVLAVRVARLPEGNKGAKLDGRNTDAGAAGSAADAPCLLSRGSDPVFDLLRRAASPALRRVLVDDAATLTMVRNAIPEIGPVLALWREPAPLMAAEGIDQEIDALLSPQVRLPSGGRLWIEETAAAVAIDVDSGGTAGGSNRSAAFACDLEAAAEIGRQIHLRELAGLIIIDFLPLRRPAERQRVLTVLRNALAGDDRQVRLAGWTRLGLMEIVRERRGPSLLRQLTAPCTACEGAGLVHNAWWTGGRALRALSAGSRGHDLSMITLMVSPAVAAILRGPLAAAFHDVEARFGRPIELRASASLPDNRFDIGGAGA